MHLFYLPQDHVSRGLLDDWTPLLMRSRSLAPVSKPRYLPGSESGQSSCPGEIIHWSLDLLTLCSSNTSILTLILAHKPLRKPIGYFCDSIAVLLFDYSPASRERIHTIDHPDISEKYSQALRTLYRSLFPTCFMIAGAP